MSVFASTKTRFYGATKTRSSFWGVKLRSYDAPSLPLINGRQKRESIIKRIRKAPLKKKLIVVSSAVLSVGVIIAGIFAYLTYGVDWQMLEDERIARNYIPSNEIAAITSSLRLTRKGKAVFYATSPELQKNTVFNAYCGRDGDDVYTQGCYFPGGDTERIIIFDQGVGLFDENGLKYNFADSRKMTALHEMLHAAYERLDDKKKEETCSELRLITDRISELGNELKLYPEEQICSESFARVGSEYIARFNAVSPNVSLSGYSLNDKEKKAINYLSNLYNQYFDVKNSGLIDAYWQNKNNLDDYLKQIVNRSDELEKQYYLALGAVESYTNNPTNNNRSVAQTEVNSYLDIYDEVNNMIISYQKIDIIKDSEKLLVGDGYIYI